MPTQKRNDNENGKVWLPFLVALFFPVVQGPSIEFFSAVELLRPPFDQVFRFFAETMLHNKESWGQNHRKKIPSKDYRKKNDEDKK